MQRQAKDFIVFPLDVPTVEDARRYVELLADEVGLFKVGLELFVAAGPEMVRFVNSAGGAGVFLDLKLHDIPATVFRAMRVVADLQVKFATVHCGEDYRMLEAAVAGGRNRVGVLGVTVLTSTSADNLHDAGYVEKYSSDLSALVLKRAAMAHQARCAGVVCSGLEVEMIKNRLGDDFLAVTPGIRPTWDVPAEDDQKRVVTPAEAVRKGSNYLVIGRPIRDAKDPKNAARRIAAEIETALSGHA